jgi:hypothetical protein
MYSSAADTYHVDADPNPAFYIDADPDPSFRFDADPTFHYDADQSHQFLTYRPSKAPLLASMALGSASMAPFGASHTSLI